MTGVGGSWRVAPRIVTLSRGRERIFFNPERFFPVHLPEGGEELACLLEELRSSLHASPPDSGSCPADLFRFLCEHAILVPPDCDEPLVSSPQAGCTGGDCDASAQGAGRPSRLQLFLLLSHLCNLSCVYCLNGRETYQAVAHKVMSLETARTAVTTLIESLADPGMLEVVFFGGEPLLNWPLALALMRWCREEIGPRYPGREIRFSLTTNLYRMPADLPKEAVRYGLSVLVNVDGPAALHDVTRPAHRGTPTFAQVKANMAQLCGEGVTVDLRATITTVNVAHMVDVAACHRDLGGASSALLPMNPIDSDGSPLPTALLPDPAAFASGLLAVYHAHIWPVADLYPFSAFNRRLQPGMQMGVACTAHLGCRPVVTAEGRIFSCPYLVNQERFVMGTLATGDFPRADAVAALTDLVDLEQRQDCRSCGYRYLCGGGCPLGMFSSTIDVEPLPEVRGYMDAMNCAVARSCIETLLWARGQTLAEGDG